MPAPNPAHGSHLTVRTATACRAYITSPRSYRTDRRYNDQNECSTDSYTSTKNVAQQLKTAKRPAAFEEQHRAELTAYRAAAAYFKANNTTKLPSPKKLEAEYAQLASEKAKFYEQYKEAKEELLKLKTAKQNVASFFREEEQAQQER